MKNSPHQIKGLSGKAIQRGGLSQITDSLLIIPQLNKIEKSCKVIKLNCGEIVNIINGVENGINKSS